MNGQQIKALRERNSWPQQRIADLLNEALGKKYGSASVSAWENGKRPVPEHVAVFLDELGAAQLPPPSETPQPSPGAEDTPPGSDGGTFTPFVSLASASTAYARVCENLWEMVATGVGMIGAATGNDKLRRDGEIIDADKEKLGKAYGKLAETNETFRHMIDGMTTSSAWLEVSLATGTTVGAIWRNHSEGSDGGRSLYAVPREPEPQPETDAIPVV